MFIRIRDEVNWKTQKEKKIKKYLEKFKKF